jgi:hypothetical protein
MIAMDRGFHLTPAVLPSCPAWLSNCYLNEKTSQCIRCRLFAPLMWFAIGSGSVRRGHCSPKITSHKSESACWPRTKWRVPFLITATMIFLPNYCLTRLVLSQNYKIRIWREIQNSKCCGLAHNIWTLMRPKMHFPGTWVRSIYNVVWKMVKWRGKVSYFAFWFINGCRSRDGVPTDGLPWFSPCYNALIKTRFDNAWTRSKSFFGLNSDENMKVIV